MLCLPVEKLHRYLKYSEPFISLFGKFKVAEVASKTKQEISRVKEEHISNGNVSLEILWVQYLILLHLNKIFD